MRTPYQWFKDVTTALPRTDIWRAAAGIIIAFVILYALTGCATQSGPSMTVATSYEGDGFIRVSQPIYDTRNGQWFVEYEHHSEIFSEENEDVGDFGIIGYRHQFDTWRWQK